MSRPRASDIQPRDVWVDHPQGRIFAREWSPTGVGAHRPTSPIVLFHDPLGCVELWRDFPAELSAASGRRVIAYDRLGFGRSDAREALPALDFIAEEAQAYFPAVREQLGLERFVVFGHSVGGGMAVNCVAHCGDACVALSTESAQTFVEVRPLERAKKYFDDLNIKFIPGVNEDLAATSVWGTHQVGFYQDHNVDGVFGIWYGKAPGIDRSGDVIRHANANGTAPKGGVLAIFGDDHACKSSTLPCQSDHALYAMQVPQLYPASIQEFVEYGLLGIAMSRYSGCWSALKVTSETVETSGTVDLTRETRPHPAG